MRSTSVSRAKFSTDLVQYTDALRRLSCPKAERHARQNGYSDRRSTLGVIGGNPVTFDPADYRDRDLIAGGDFLAELAPRIADSRQIPVREALNRPDLVREVGRFFVGAGADILTTCTDEANAVLLADELASGSLDLKQLADANRLIAVACRNAINDAGEQGLVFGSLGPVGQILSLNEIESDLLYEAWYAQAIALAEGGVDAILCRSFDELEALLIAVKASREATGLAVIGSMTFGAGPEGTETIMRTTVPQACHALTEAGSAMVGADRSEAPDGTAAIVSLMREACELPLWVEVNAGRVQVIEGRMVYPEAPEEFAARYKAIRAAGAQIIGGGNGATIAHIAALADIRSLLRKRRMKEG